jgi:hypothetical protein
VHVRIEERLISKPSGTYTVGQSANLMEVFVLEKKNAVVLG